MMQQNRLELRGKINHPTRRRWFSALPFALANKALLGGEGLAGCSPARCPSLCWELIAISSHLPRLHLGASSSPSCQQ